MERSRPSEADSLSLVKEFPTVLGILMHIIAFTGPETGP